MSEGHISAVKVVEDQDCGSRARACTFLTAAYECSPNCKTRIWFQELFTCFIFASGGQNHERRESGGHTVALSSRAVLFSSLGLEVPPACFGVGFWTGLGLVLDCAAF